MRNSPRSITKLIRTTVFASYLAFRTRELMGEMWIGGLYLSVLLKALPEKPDWKGGDGKGLLQFAEEFTTKGYKHLIFPANVNRNHWIVFKVDVEERAFCIGTLLYLAQCTYTTAYCLPTSPRGLPAWWEPGS